jgi:hypothetical protein
MIRLNAAFAAEDRVRLELMATEIEQGEGTTLDDPVNAEAHMQRRLAELSPLSDKLELELRRTRAAAAYRRLQDARGREATGQDYFREVREQTAAQARAARATFAERGARIEEAARALNAHFVSKTRAPGKAGTDFSALEPPLPYRLAITAAEPCSGAADVSGKSLRRLAREAPWKAAWVMAAVFAEIAGRPPAGLATFSAWSTWHETLRAGRRAVPAFEDALGELPAVLEVGCRLHHDGLRFGVMLRDPDGSAFDPEAMAGAPCSQLAADLLTALAPRAECGACERVVPLVHVHRLRDVDPLHAFVCSRCGEVLEKYRAVGRAEGFEALAPYAVAVGLVEELTVWFGSTTFRIGLLTKERRRLTSERLAQIFFEAALGSDDAAEHPGGYAGAAKRGLSVSADGRRLARGERVPRAGKH